MPPRRGSFSVVHGRRQSRELRACVSLGVRRCRKDDQDEAGGASAPMARLSDLTLRPYVPTLTADERGRASGEPCD